MSEQNPNNKLEWLENSPTPFTIGKVLERSYGKNYRKVLLRQESKKKSPEEIVKDFFPEVLSEELDEKNGIGCKNCRHGKSMDRNKEMEICEKDIKEILSRRKVSKDRIDEEIARFRKLVGLGMIPVCC